MRQFDSEVVNIPTLELVGIVSTPCALHVKAEQCARIIADDIIEIGIVIYLVLKESVYMILDTLVLLF
jgi:hypothetical protein